MNNEPPDLPEVEERHIKTKFIHHRPDGEMPKELVALYENRTLAVPRIQVMPLEDAVAAHKQSESGSSQGKIVLKIQDL